MKREVVGSIFPEKFTFDGKDFRIIRMNEGVEVIFSLDDGSSKIKLDKTEGISICPAWLPRLEQNHTWINRKSESAVEGLKEIIN